MKRPFIPLILIAVGLLALAACISPALSQVPGGSISGRIQTNTATFPNNTFVELVNPANYSEEYTQYNTTPDKDGFFQFTNVSFGDYSVFAYAPYYSWGVSSPMHITDNTTYTASIVMLAEPVFADFNPGSVVVSYNGVSEINVTIYDHWGNVVPAWYIVLQSSSGKQPDPSSGYTDKNGNFKSSIPYQENVGQPAVTAWAKAANGSYYELQGGELPTVTPSATPGTIPSNNTSNATVNASPNATAQVNATVTVVATGTPSATPVGTAKPTPGFELIAGILAICIAIAISKIK